MKTFCKVIALMAATLLAGFVPAWGQKVPSETWMGIYFGQSKIGYAKFAVEKDEYRGKPAYKLESISSTQMLVLGMDVSQEVETTVYLDEKYLPMYQTFKMSSAGRSTSVTATFGKREIIAELEAQGAKNRKKIPIPEGSKVVWDSTFLSPDVKFRVGDKLDFKAFNPLTLTLDDIHTEVLRTEDIEVGDGNSEKSYVIQTNTPMGDMTSWQDEEGEIIKVIGPMGITMVRESRDSATAMGEGTGYAPPSDLAVLTSAATTVDIPNPRDVKSMQVKLSGLADRSFAISDARQEAAVSDEGGVQATYKITATEYDADRARRLPVRSKAVNEFLKESAYVQSSKKEIKSLARRILGNETNSYRAVSLLRTWVNENMESKGDIGILRTSTDVLKTKTGVCRDYAMLYTAMARSVGIPTKLVAGLIYWKGGFYYHAWSESYVGEWVSVDPTLSTDFVDATHIKLAEGDTAAMFSLVKTIGSIKAEIVEYR